ncbi:MAG: hypothetical protein II567_10590 [Candidatus Riflebacteria bacterium]|nr:hypothetical protein [Candidatus Riflebacteria bacterium]
MKLIDNPFYILKCMPESSKSTIHEQAEERSFDIDENICKNAENILINPKKRLQAEISWFPGFEIKTVSDRIKAVITDSRRYISDLIICKTKNYLAEANLLAFGLAEVKNVSEWSKDEIRMAASFLCTFCEKINVEDSINKILLSREKSKFPTNILEEDAVYYIDEQKHYYEKTLYDFFQKIDSEAIVDVLTKMAKESTNSGRNTCKWYLLENLISKYEMDLSDFISEEKSIIIEDLDSIEQIVSSNKDDKFNDLFYKLEKDLNDWKTNLYPIMVIKMGRGLNDENSENIFYAIRKLMLVLVNNYSKYTFSVRLNKLCGNIFTELRSVQDLINSDYSILSSLAQKADDEARETKAFMEFHYEWGTLMKSSVKTTEKTITIDGNDTYNYEDIEKIKWSKKVDSSFSNELVMTIQFVAKNRLIPEMLVPDSEIVYDRLKEILWRGCGDLIINRYLNELIQGRSITLGPIVLFDYGIQLTTKGFIFSSTQFYTWRDIKSVSYDNGVFELIGPEGYKFSIDTDSEYNLLAIYVILNKFFKDGNGIRISSLIQ